MPIQDVLLKGVNIPEGYEPTGEFRGFMKGEAFISESGEGIDFAHYSDAAAPRIILRKTEPAAIRMAKKVNEILDLYESATLRRDSEIHQLAKQVIAQHKESAR